MPSSPPGRGASGACWLAVLLLLAHGGPNAGRSSTSTPSRSSGSSSPMLAAAAAPPAGSDASGAAGPGGKSVSVLNGYELHAALTTADVDTIVMLRDISMTYDTCPTPHSDKVPPSQRRRSIVITSDPAGPYVTFDCSLMSRRLMFMPGATVTFRHVLLKQCGGPEDLMIFGKAPGSTVFLDDVIEDLGSTCLDADAAAAWFQAAPRPPDAPPAAAANGNSNNKSAQLLVVAPGNKTTNWCTPGNTLPGVPRLANYNQTLCSLHALLLQDVAVSLPSADVAAGNGSSGGGGNWTQVYRNTLQVCPQPLQRDCVQMRNVSDCARTAFDALNPDNNHLEMAPDAYQLHKLLAAPPPGTRGIILLGNITLSLASSPPVAAADGPVWIRQDLLIRADPRGPRLFLDCGLLTDRFRLAPGRTLTLQHLVISNCSVTSPFSFVAMSPGSTLNLTDSVVRPAALCVPLADRVGEVYHSPRPTSGVQRLRPGAPGAWCQANATDDASSSSSSSSSSSALAASAANPLGATALLDDPSPEDALPTAPSRLLDALNWAIPAPAAAPYFAAPSWMGVSGQCNRSALLLQDVVLQLDVVPIPRAGNNASSAANATAAAGNASAGGSSGVDAAAAGPYTLVYNNSAWLPCSAPVRNCSSRDSPDTAACLAAAYQLINPDLNAEAVAAGERQRKAYVDDQAAALQLATAATGQDGSSSSTNRSVAVVLPAVLVSVVTVVLCVAIVGLFYHRKHSHRGKGDAEDPSSLKGDGPLLSSAALKKGALAAPPSSSSGSGKASSDTLTTSTRDASNPSTDAPEGISLGVLVGAGSYGRVYKGSWRGQLVAVKVVMHNSADAAAINRELQLTSAFQHPQLVGLLHYLRLSASSSHAAAQRTPAGHGSAGSDLSLPSGAVGVFTVGSGWTLAGPSATHSAVPDMETWIVMELMDRGDLATAVRRGTFVQPLTRDIREGPLLRRLRDVAAGVAYLHQQGVCHGDLKCENVLLKSDAEDPHGCVAKVADFGLSRALAAGQSHLSTRRYGTVSHMPPELLTQGRLTTATDVYSFGIIMWEVVSGNRPFDGLHHGEIIHKVVSEGLRPGPWPAGVTPEYLALARACWAQDPEQRPSMDDVHKALGTLLEGLASSADKADGA